MEGSGVELGYERHRDTCLPLDQLSYLEYEPASNKRTVIKNMHDDCFPFK